MEGFKFQDDTNGLYEEQSPTFSEGERGYYKHVTHPFRCIWWHRNYNHWWIGHCDHRGLNQGHAWLGPSSLCPAPSEIGQWHQGGTDQVLQGLVRLPEATEATQVEAKGWPFIDTLAFKTQNSKSSSHPLLKGPKKLFVLIGS